MSPNAVLYGTARQSRPIPGSCPTASTHILQKNIHDKKITKILTGDAQRSRGPSHEAEIVVTPPWPDPAAPQAFGIPTPLFGGHHTARRPVRRRSSPTLSKLAVPYPTDHRWVTQAAGCPQAPSFPSCHTSRPCIVHAVRAVESRRDAALLRHAQA